MRVFQNTVVREIHPPITVFSERGRVAHTVDRPCFALSFCLGGQITYIHNGARYVSRPDNAVLLPAGATYSLHGDREGLFPVINFACEGLDVADFLLFDLTNPREFLSQYRRIAEYALAGNRLMMFQVFYGMLAGLDAAQTEANPYLSFVEERIRSRLADPTLTNAELAREAGISEVYLRKLFTKHYACTPKQYILGLRLQAARQLLSNTRSSITDVSERCGFSSVYHFCRCFKEKVGCTPSDYAKRNRVYEP